jgi:hypothetical protein
MSRKEVYDMSENSQNLANVDYILSSIIPILEYIKTPALKQMFATDYVEYKLHLEAKYPKFSNEYYSVFQKVISGDDLSPLLDMLAMVNKINNKEYTLEEAEGIVGKTLVKKFIK